IPDPKKKRDKPAIAGQSRLPILKERRTLIVNITLIENNCQLLMKNFINNFLRVLILADSRISERLG
ncbi:MAG: hypothetical protein C6Y22_16310, partial [Hapalosiphonaceae cyanobacterium JJU2]